MKLIKTNQNGLYKSEMSEKDILDSIIRIEKKKEILASQNKNTKKLDNKINKLKLKIN